MSMVAYSDDRHGKLANGRIVIGGCLIEFGPEECEWPRLAIRDE